MTKVTAILLAAGLSRRTGTSNKLLHPMADGRPLIAVTAAQLALCDAEEAIVVLGHEAERVRRALAACDATWRFVVNADFSRGMTSSIQRGVRKASQRSGGYMICLGDQPLIEGEDYQRFLDVFRAEEGRRLIVPQFEGRRGNPVILPSILRDEILGQTAVDGCRQVVEARAELVLPVPARSDAVLRDFDHPHQFEEPPFVG